jgi:hypothetical protein
MNLQQHINYEIVYFRGTSIEALFESASKKKTLTFLGGSNMSRPPGPIYDAWCLDPTYEASYALVILPTLLIPCCPLHPHSKEIQSSLAPPIRHASRGVLYMCQWVS